jgi:hypothetical protein
MFGIAKEQILGLIRHVVTFVGGVLVARGKVDPAQLETVVGIIATVAGFLLSMMSPEKTLTPEKIIAVMEPAKAAAVANILAQPEPPKPLPAMGMVGGPAPPEGMGKVRAEDRVEVMPPSPSPPFKR